MFDDWDFEKFGMHMIYWLFTKLLDHVVRIYHCLFLIEMYCGIEWTCVYYVHK